MRAVGDGCSDDDSTANQKNSNNDCPFFFILPYYMFPQSLVLEKERYEDNGCVLSLFSLIECHYSDEMLFLRAKTIK